MQSNFNRLLTSSMKVYGIALIVLLNVLHEVKLQAPGDASSSCTSHHRIPRNYQVLLDSFWYVSLLQSSRPSLWQEVDVDGLTDFSKHATTWTQEGDRSCQQAVQSCHFYLPTQNNWLITQHINRTIHEDTLLPQVIAQVEFQILPLCIQGCQKSIEIEVWETSVISRTQARVISQYRQVGRIIANQEAVHEPQNASIPINFQTNATGFYLALVDGNTCVAITRVLVFYYVCPAVRRKGLMSYPETPSPPIVEHPVPTATISCGNGSAQQQGSSSLVCVERGIWCTTEIPGSSNLPLVTMRSFGLFSERIGSYTKSIIKSYMNSEGSTVSSVLPVLAESPSLQSKTVGTTKALLMIYILSAVTGILLLALLLISILLIIMRSIHPRASIQQNVGIDEDENIYQEISSYQVRPPSPYIQPDDNPSYGIPLASIKKYKEVDSLKKDSTEYLEDSTDYLEVY